MTSTRAEAIFGTDLQKIVLRTDRMFFWLLIGQWVGAILVAVMWSPRTWIAQYWSIHQHVIAAAILGGVFAAYPLYLIVRKPGTRYTRHMIAIGQMLQSALLVHVTGGRIETHFHVFGSLALLAFYRDWPVLLTGSAVVYLDHLALGMWFPLAVYGVASASVWRSVEHAFWVVFEVVFLRMSCLTGIRELRAIAEREVELEDAAAHLRQSNTEMVGMSQELQRTNQILEERVAERTEQLKRAKEGLEEEVAQRTKELAAAKANLEVEVAHRTQELATATQKLQDQVQELEFQNRIMMGREERILELKQELKVLHEQLAAQK
jgi:hypothetical protein